MPLEIDADALDFTGIVRPGDLVVLGQASAEPLVLTRQFMAQRHSIGRFRAFIGITLSFTADPEHADCIDFSSFCGTGNNRRLAAAGKLDILPLHYSRLTQTLRREVDILLLQLAEHPDGGRYSLAATCDYVQDLVPAARLVIAEVNRQAPFTDALIDPADIDMLVRSDYEPVTMASPVPSPVDRQIATHAAELVADGATVQFGLGALPECVALLLGDRRDLGLHTGVMSDAAMKLMQQGVVNNLRKPHDTGVSITGGLLGSGALLAFADHNPAISLRPISFTHDIATIAALPRFTAVNSAIEVDLSGQANTETANGRYLGGIGGAVDFCRAAHASEGGIPIVALPSVATMKDGTVVSRIVASLAGPATIGRADIGVVVTEHGIADLRGQSLSQRARLLVAIADPRFRDELMSASRM